MDELSNEAATYFDAHLVDDPVTTKMLARARRVAGELEDAGLTSVLGAAKLLRALEQCDADCSDDLPFELDELTRQVIDGAQSKGAMTRHCTSDRARQAAAALNTIHRTSRQKMSYAWADEVLHDSPLKTYAHVSLRVIDDALAEIPVALDNELRFLPRLDTKQALDSDTEHQIVLVAARALFWAEDGQVHCGMSERYSRGWANAARFARRRGFPIHVGFQGELLSDERIDEILEIIEKPR